MKPVTLTLATRHTDWLHNEKEKTELSMSDIMRRLINEKIESEKKAEEI